jgi:hypothetical protein
MFTDLLLRLRSLLRRSAVEEELDDELRFHLEQQVAANVCGTASHLPVHTCPASVSSDTVP